MFFLKRHKDKQEMDDIKDELNEPLDGPIGPANRPVVERVSDMDESGEWKEDFKMPNNYEPLLQPDYEPRPEPIRAPPVAPMPVEPINRIPMSEEMMATSKSDSPLFIKVDKYSDLLAHVREMKIFLTTTKQTLGIIDEIETARTDAIKILRAATTRLERVLETADQELLKPEITEEQVEVAGREEAAYVEDTLQSLKREIDDLKRDLHRME